MNDRWHLRVTDTKGIVYEATDLEGPAVIGRQQNSDEKLHSHVQVDGRWRIVIAPLTEDNVSRRHLEVKPIAAGQVLLTNKSDKQPVRLTNGQELGPKANCVVTLPTVVKMGSKTVRLYLEEDDLL